MVGLVAQPAPGFSAPNPASAADPDEPVPWHRPGGPHGSAAEWEDKQGLPLRRTTDMPSYQEMVDNWSKFGFIEPVQDGTAPITHWRRFRETERADQIPDHNP